MELATRVLKKKGIIMLRDLRDQILRREIKYSYYTKILRVNN